MNQNTDIELKERRNEEMETYLRTLYDTYGESHYDLEMRFEKDGNTLLQYKGYTYYKDNPALSIHDAVRTILEACEV